METPITTSSPPTQALKDFGFSSFLAQADPIILGVLVVLVLMSIATWYLILNKGLRTWLSQRRSLRVVKRFWAAGSLGQALAELDRGRSTDGFTELVRQGVSADTHYRSRRSGRHAATASS